MAHDLLVTNGTVLTFDPAAPLVERGAVYIHEGEVSAVGPAAELEAKHPRALRVDAGGGVIMPGLILAHTHFYGAFARGIDVGQPGPANFPEILQKLWWRLDAVLTPEDVADSALLSLVAAARAGTTALVDHHASPNAIDGSLSIIRDAARKIGLRACLCYEVTDRNTLRRNRTELTDKPEGQ